MGVLSHSRPISPPYVFTFLCTVSPVRTTGPILALILPMKKLRLQVVKCLPKDRRGRDRARTQICVPQQRAPSPAVPLLRSACNRRAQPGSSAAKLPPPQNPRWPVRRGKPYSTCISESACSSTRGLLKVPRLAPRAQRICSRTRCQPASGLRGDAGPEGRPEPGAGK